jgi:uncharacterized protein (DUF362 family)
MPGRLPLRNTVEYVGHGRFVERAPEPPQRPVTDRAQALKAVAHYIVEAGGTPAFAAKVVKSLESVNGTSKSHKETGLHKESSVT